MAKLTRTDAIDLATRHGFPLDRDFHSLGSDTVAAIIRAADERGYRKPRNANGSRARYFYARLARLTEARDPQPVMFRMGDGEVIAVFPTIPGASAAEMVCYSHVGQHGACSTAWLATTRPATDLEAVDLRAELSRIYERHDDPDCVRLVTVRRISPAMNRTRRTLAATF